MNLFSFVNLATKALATEAFQDFRSVIKNNLHICEFSIGYIKNPLNGSRLTVHS
jgi:hypothetical protein